jgi:hypothetical protein
MLFGGHDSDFLAKVSEGLKKLPFSRKFWITTIWHSSTKESGWNREEP